jgi:hypothetical protein
MMIRPVTPKLSNWVRERQAPVGEQAHCFLQLPEIGMTICDGVTNMPSISLDIAIPVMSERAEQLRQAIVKAADI